MRQAARRYFDNIVSALQFLLSNKLVFPHLEMLHWEDIGDVSQSLFCGLAHSNIQHLELSHIEVDDNFRIDVPTWPMRSLHLELRPIIWTNLERTRSAPTRARLLRLCGPMLESISWVDASEIRPSLKRFRTDDLI